MSQYSQYLKDLVKTNLIDLISRKFGRLHTSMQCIFLLLKLKKLLPEKMVAIELFGMHGLWHTKDYIRHVQSLDLFELDTKYHQLSKKVFRGFPVRYFNEDSIKFVSTTENRYSLVVADIPGGENFYAADGMPVFWKELVRILMPGAILIFNMHSDKLGDYKKIESRIKENSNNRPIRDIFFMPRNSIMTYVVVGYE